MEKSAFRHWHRRQDDDGLVWLHFDHADSSTNVLSGETLDELDSLLVTLASEHPKGMVMLSDKPNGFVAGADVQEFTRIADAHTAQRLIRRGQEVFSRLEQLPFPTLALIHGFCLGGGLELALACRYRVALDDPGTRLGFPEVRLGIFPGFGGTVRGTRTLGPLAAMQLMLSGRALSAHQARKTGLVDQVVPERHFHHVARRLVLEGPPISRPSWKKRVPGHRLVRPLVARWMRRETRRRVNPQHYPAPFRLIEHWEHHADRPVEMYASEVSTVAELISSETSRNLVRVFQLQNQLKSLGKKGDFTPERVHVIGAGTMGGDIAAWCALRGLRVTVQDAKSESLGATVQRAASLFQQRLREPRLVQSAMDRLMPDPKGLGLRRADVVIEAVFEDVEVKHRVYRSIEPMIGEDTLLATNTSSIPLDTLGEGLTRPERLVGLHFFNPVAKMQLVEVVTAEHTDPVVARHAAAFTRHIDRLPLPVKSSPGFLVNRILMPYLLEAMEMENEDVPISLIDQAAVDFGMPMGPFELADTAGLDVCLYVAEILAESLDNVTIPRRLSSLVKAEHLGRKTGQGFYVYRNGKPLKERPPKGFVVPGGLTDRLIIRMLNEATACLREGVVANADLLDAGVIFGTGFAPFRGGPIHYIQTRGTTELQNAMRNMEQRHGHRFGADPGWSRL